MDEISGKWLKMADKTAKKNETLSTISEKQAAARKRLVKLHDLHVEPKFEKYIRKHSKEEFNALYASIEQDGKIREPLTVQVTSNDGKYLVIDGHHRLKVAKLLLEKGRLTFESLPVNVEKFNSDDEVYVWMLRNQLGRRNLSPFERAEIGFRITSFLEELAHKKKQHQKVDNKLLSKWITAPEDKKIDYAKIVSEITGVPRTTIIRAKKLYNNASDELKYEVRSGDTSISKAYEKVVEEEKKQKQYQKLAKRKNDFAKNLFQMKEIEGFLNDKIIAETLGFKVDSLKISVVKRNKYDLLYAVVRGQSLNYLNVLYQNPKGVKIPSNFVVHLVHEDTDFIPSKEEGLLSIYPNGKLKVIKKCVDAISISEEEELKLLRSLVMDGIDK